MLDFSMQKWGIVENAVALTIVKNASIFSWDKTQKSAISLLLRNFE